MDEVTGVKPGARTGSVPAITSKLLCIMMIDSGA